MGKHTKPESYGTPLRPNHSTHDSAWSNPRDSGRTPLTHDDTRLTEHERYGVTYNIDSSGSN